MFRASSRRSILGLMHLEAMHCIRKLIAHKDGDLMIYASMLEC